MSSTSLCLKQNKIGFGALKVKKKLGQPFWGKLNAKIIQAKT
jgi:hypothetical protein